jgi:nitrogen fixation/metabolism regulation signal transduction histidine kinase
MVFNRFRFGVLLRVIFIAAAVALVLFLIFRTEYVLTTSITILVTLFIVADLIKFVERTERDLTRFFQAVKYEDFFETFHGLKGSVSTELHSEFNRVIQDFKSVRLQREEQFHFLQTVVSHVGLSLISYDTDGNIELINGTACKLLRCKKIRNIESLRILSEDLIEALKGIKSGERRIVKVVHDGDILMLSMHATQFKRRGINFKLVTIQDIRSELEEKELEAWQKLIRVLTHEIRNSITPITSLANTTVDLLKSIEVDSEDMEDAKLAIKTIQKRSGGILKFVEAFRSLYKVPQPDISKVEMADLLSHIKMIVSEGLEAHSVSACYLCTPGDISFMADQELIEQVLINLVRNSIQALDGVENPAIDVSAFIDQAGRIKISVIDNGKGIREEEQEKIFIPFFTTKSDGSGIGLSLSRQIMRLHKGSITVVSTPHKETVFTLTF